MKKTFVIIRFQTTLIEALSRELMTFYNPQRAMMIPTPIGVISVIEGNPGVTKEQLLEVYNRHTQAKVVIIEAPQNDTDDAQVSENTNLSLDELLDLVRLNGVDSLTQSQRQRLNELSQ